MTRDEIVAAIRDLGYHTDVDDQAAVAVNSYYRRVNATRRWPWRVAVNTSLTLGLGEDSIDNVTGQVTDFIAPEALRLFDAAGVELPRLEYAEAQVVRTYRHDQAPATGSPFWWSLYNNAFIFDVRADEAYTAELEYIKAIPALSATSEPVWPEEYHDILVYGPASLIAARERDWTMRATMKQEYDERLSEMVKAHGTRQRQNATEVVRSPFWDSIRSYG